MASSSVILVGPAFGRMPERISAHAALRTLAIRECDATVDLNSGAMQDYSKAASGSGS
jgi:hypothetical protein